jgi:hypothetical protein
LIFGRQVGSSAVEELEMWLGAQNPDCCNWGGEGEERGNDSGVKLIGTMKMTFFPPFKDEGEVVAAWGEAQLIKYLDGKLELKGGSKEDRIEAREWISMFLCLAAGGPAWRPAAGRDGWQKGGGQKPFGFLPASCERAAGGRLPVRGQ